MSDTHLVAACFGDVESGSTCTHKSRGRAVIHPGLRWERRCSRRGTGGGFRGWGGGGGGWQDWKKCAVAVNSEFVWHAEHNAGLQEGETCCFHVPKPCSRSLKTSVFTQVGSLGTISVRKKGE